MHTQFSPSLVIAQVVLAQQLRIRDRVFLTPPTSLTVPPLKTRNPQKRAYTPRWRTIAAGGRVRYIGGAIATHRKNCAQGIKLNSLS